jgi:lambda family phage tail tape measure protein
MAVGDNTLQIVLSARDQTGSAFAGAARNAKMMESALGGLSKAGAGFEDFIGKLQRGASIFGVSLGLASLINFSRGIVSTVGGLEDLATQLGISTQALQAYQAAAATAGVKDPAVEGAFTSLAKKMGEANNGSKEAIDLFDKLNIKVWDASKKLRPVADVMTEVAVAITKLDSATEKSARSQEVLGQSGAKWLSMMDEISMGTGALQGKMTAWGLTVDDKVIKKLQEWDNQLTVLEKQWKLTFAVFLAENVPPVIEEMTKKWEATKKELEAVANLYRLLGGKMLLPQAEVDNLRQGEARVRQDEAIKKLEEEAAFYRNLNANGVNEQQRLNNLEKIRDIEAEIARILGATPPVVVRGGPSGVAPLVEPAWGLGGFPPPKKGTFQPGVKGAGEDMAKQIEKLRLEGEDFAQALAKMSANTNTPWPEWQKQVESFLKVEKQVSDFRAANKLGENDPMAVRFRAQAEATEQARQKLEDYKTAASDADKFERQWGDGKMELNETLVKLDRALANGRLSWEAYTIAVQKAKEAQEEQSLKMRAALGENTFDGFIAGIRQAQIEWDRANSAFELGQKAFQNAMTAMEGALTTFVTTGKLNFRDLANSIIADILRMSIRAASSSIFSAIGSLFSSTPGGVDNFGNPLRARAGGGPVDAGQPYLTGEHGPEIFVPGRSGTIVANDDIAGMGGGGINIYQSYTVTGGDEGAVDRAMLKWMPVMKQQALDAVLNARVRGGAFAQAFRS